ncbi:SDR family NAD(P)-dependent oxidoreductase [Streptomyces sp. NPDC048484]|uniref:SDR family oxidoreductase n=1 Tax=Streptomyces sp. NPDC048484 TaxID=3155146 RepID=UPI00344A8AB3
MNHLEGKVVVITGASSGIGAVSAKALAARGATIVAAARGQEALDQLVTDIEKAGGTAGARLTDVADAADAADMQALADFTVDTYGRIDVLVNNAGLMLFSYWKDLTLQDWNRMIDVNIRGYLNGVHAVLPVMLRQKSPRPPRNSTPSPSAPRPSPTPSSTPSTSQPTSTSTT